MINDSMNRDKAKIAVNMVQQQSVHFLCFSYTGRFLKVNTLLVNKPIFFISFLCLIVSLSAIVIVILYYSVINNDIFIYIDLDLIKFEE